MAVESSSLMRYKIDVAGTPTVVVGETDTNLNEVINEQAYSTKDSGHMRHEPLKKDTTGSATFKVTTGDAGAAATKAAVRALTKPTITVGVADGETWSGPAVITNVSYAAPDGDIIEFTCDYSFDDTPTVT